VVFMKVRGYEGYFNICCAPFQYLGNLGCLITALITYLGLYMVGLFTSVDLDA